MRLFLSIHSGDMLNINVYSKYYIPIQIYVNLFILERFIVKKLILYHIFISQAISVPSSAASSTFQSLLQSLTRHEQKGFALDIQTNIEHESGPYIELYCTLIMINVSFENILEHHSIPVIKIYHKVFEF